MKPIADAERTARQPAGENGSSQAADDRPTPLCLTALWVAGAVSFAAIIFLFTPFTYQLDDIKVTLQYSGAPIVGALVALALFYRYACPIHPWIGLTLLAYILLGLLSALLADYHWLAWEQYGFELTLMVAFATVAFTATTPERFKNFCRFYFAVGCVTIVFGLFHLFGGVTWMLYHLYPGGKPPAGGPAPLYALLMTLDRNRQMLSTILNRDFYPAYLVMIVPLAVALFSDSRRPLGRAYYAIAGFLYCFCIVLARSNDSNLALTVMTLLFVALMIARQQLRTIPRQVLLVWIAGSALIVATALFFIRSYFSDIPNQFPYAVRSRSIIWSGALGIFFDPSQPIAVFLRRMILGCGPGGFMILLPQYQSPDFYRWAIAPITQFSHSQPLDLLSERGLLGTAAFAAFLGGILWLLFRDTRRRHDDPLILYQIALLTAIMGISIQNLTSPNIRWTACGFNYWFLLGLSAAAIRLSAPIEERGTRDRSWALPAPLRRVAVGSLLGIVLAFGVISMPFGVRRFVSAVYNNNARIKINDMAVRVSQMSAAPAGAQRETLRRQAVDFARAAEADLERSIRWLPSFISSSYLLGHAYGRHASVALDKAEIAEMRRRAIEAYDRLSTYDPDYAEIHVGYGMVYRQAYSDTQQPADRDMAIDHLDKAARSTNELQTQMIYANALTSLGESERAKALYWRILELAKAGAPDPSGYAREALNELLTQARSANDAKQIVTLCRRRLEDQPRDAATFVELIENLRRLGRDPEALDFCHNWIEQNSLDPLPRNMAAKILLDHGARSEALKQIAAMQRIQDRRQPTVAGPWALPAPGRVAELRDPRPEELWFRAGQVAEQLNRTSDALSYYQKSMEIARDSRLAWRAREALESLRARRFPPLPKKK